MAPQSKKNSKTSSIKKKPIVKKTPVKKKVTKTKPRKKTKKSKKSSKKIIIIFLLLLLMLSFVGVGYYWGQKSNNTEVKEPIKKHQKKYLNQKIKNQKHKTKTPAKKVKPRTRKQIISHGNKPVKLAYRGEKPKLVIIIDDVHTRAQIDAIQALKMKVTPSIFPPYSLSPQSHLLAKGLKHYMIHLPMESGNQQFNKQDKTLKVSFSNAQLEKRVKELRKLFPTAKYINNHTGSVFTSNTRAMKSLYALLRGEGFIFVDSLTTGASKVKGIAHRYGDDYVARDTFIDNVHEVDAIHTQLYKAVKLAKKNGYAVVIGHPHPSTIKALSLAKSLFVNVDLVYIDALYH